MDMKIAVFSDIHGNCFALDAMLADLQGEPVDRMVCLGDAIQGGPQPAQVVARLRELGCPVVMGNADAWLLSGAETGAEQIPEARMVKMNAVREWHLSQLSEQDQAFIAAFQPSVEVALDGGRTLLCYHGSPGSFDDIILPVTPQDELAGYLDPQPHIVYTGGHTHVQFIRHMGRTFHFNPGSVGFAYRHDQPEGTFRADPWAEYALLTVDGERVELTFRRAPYDAGELIDVYRSSGRPFADEAIADYGG
jgi:predicted phosphodiesterase